MIGATNDEMTRTFASMDLQCEGKKLSFSGTGGNRIRIVFRMQEPHQMVYLARLLAHLSYDEIHFRGSYLWVTASDIWNPLEEAVALKTLEQFRRSHGENRSVEAAPGTYFRHDEFVESVCCLMQPMLVGWDAYYVPTWGWGGLQYFVAVSHDGYADVEVRTPETYDPIMKILAGHDWIRPLMK